MPAALAAAALPGASQTGMQHFDLKHTNSVKIRHAVKTEIITPYQRNNEKK